MHGQRAGGEDLADKVEALAQDHFGVGSDMAAGDAGRIRCADDRADGGSGDQIGADAEFVQGLQHRDMGDAACAAAAEGEGYRWCRGAGGGDARLGCLGVVHGGSLAWRERRGKSFSPPVEKSGRTSYREAMTRTEAIATITAKLASLDDERLRAVAEIVDDVAADEAFRPLTARELELLEQSKADFAAGRTLTLAEARARTDAALAERRALRSKA